MSGAAKIVKGVASSAGKLVTGKGNIRDAANVGLNMMTFGTAGVLDQGLTGGKILGSGSGGGGGPAGLNGLSQDTPAGVLAMTGGAPLLANVALGADVKSAIAGYFGASNYDDFYSKLSDSDKQLVDGVQGQLSEIQNNTQLKNQAVQQVVNDFPNIVAHAANARSAAGEEFDATTKSYLDQALGKVGAQYAAGGNLSSGAMAAAAARTGADLGLTKLSYQDQREQSDLSTQETGWQARYNEANALRNFQNTMTQGAAGNGFSAVQAALNRTANVNQANAGYANQQKLQDQANQNALFGSIGTLAGTVAGAAIAGPAGAAVGSQVGKMASSGGGAADYGFSGPATPGYAANNSAMNPNW